MKKTLLKLTALLALIGALALITGCEKKEPTADTQPDESAEVTAQGDTEETPGASTFYYSDGITDDGYWAGVRALDYVELFDYNALTIPAETHTVAEDALAVEIDEILASYTSTAEVTDRAVEDGDIVNIDYVGSVDGVPFDGGDTGGMGTQVTIGVTMYIDDFLEQLIGHMPGDTFDVNVTFPEDYGVEELNGQGAVFVTTINFIVENTSAVLTDEFVATTFGEGYGWSNVEEFRTAVETNLRKASMNKFIQDYVLANVTVSEIPTAMVDYQANLLIQSYEETAAYYGITLEELLEMYGIPSRELLVESSIADTENAARYYLILQAIAEDMGLTVSDADVAEFFKTEYNTEDFSMYTEDYGMPYLKYTVMCKRVIDHIAENAVLG